MVRTLGVPVAARATAAALLLAGARGAAAQAPYRNAALPVEARVRDLLGRMTVEEKFWQLFMLPGSRADPTHDYSHGVFGLQDRRAADPRRDAIAYDALQHYFVDSTRLGIPMLAFEEGVHGVMRRGATVFPAAIALAATFDTARVGAVAAAIAGEARSRGIRQLLAPVINIATDVRWGRVEETYGEDPYLTSVMGRTYVRALERHGVIATPKHFVANVGAGGRDSYPIDASPRALGGLHFPPFRAAIQDAGAGSVMTAYNSVDGVPASQNGALLNGTLRRDWGFRGFVISDQSAVGGAVALHRTEASTATATRHALEAGLDVIFQSSYPEHRPYLAAVRGGTIAAAAIDSAVARVLRAKFALGLFERPYVDPDSARMPDDAARALARDAARASLVLLRNEHATLPLRPDVPDVAVVGIDASEPRLGGYTIDSARGVSILDGLRARLGDRVRYAPGPGRTSETFVVVGREAFDTLQGEYFDNIALAGTPRVVRRDAQIDFRWTFNAPAPGIANDWYSVRWTGRLRAPAGGVRRLGVEGSDGYRLWVDGALVIDDWRKQSSRATLVPAVLAAGTTHDVRLEFHEGAGNARVRLVWDAGVPNDRDARIDSAVALARRSAVAVVVAGIEEGEFRDRASLALPGRQEELIRRVAATGTPTAVVLVGGSAITMSRWIDSVGAVLMAWYPGAEGGHAVADVLLGDAAPGGRLPVTFPIAEGQLPLSYYHEPTGRGDDYVDLTGAPAFPFGFGTSYTTFAYDSLRIEPTAVPNEGRVAVSFRVRNTGRRAGDEVPQLYVRAVVSSVARPVLALQGFARVSLAAGEARTVTIPLDARALRAVDARGRWIVEPGMYRLLVGASSRDIRLRGEVQVRP
ncbi:glycoside hydrolase family 3 N-terminal domain-containing protein [Gemmatirosa kalamazoonensis]|uniref:glycoside hydrolase family 3 N-terminal domain-containing protein n=1 Tax=Gemmatirosa kalamazoonensis TaxID=861299 RepID=UPI00046CF8EF|nr:glycoside hydrolase family 3 N-terminal domain-containing protein [Gemmatirosa kalamazoonensis]